MVQYQIGVSTKVGGSSSATTELEINNLGRVITLDQRVPNDGFNVFTVSGQGKIGTADTDRKLTALMLDIVAGRHQEKYWKAAKDRILTRATAHHLDISLFTTRITDIERILNSGNIKPESIPCLVGAPELFQAQMYFELAKQKFQDKEFVLLNDPLAIIGENSGRFTDVYIDFAETARRIQSREFKDLIRGKIAINPGFILELTRNGKMTLGTGDRGGSDASATCLGEYLDLDEILIYSDQPGIFPLPPNVHTGLNPLTSLTPQEAFFYSTWGAGIIQQLAILPILTGNRPLWIKSSLEPELPGTLIGGANHTANYGTRAIACLDNVTMVTVEEIPDRPGESAKISKIFADNNYNIIHEPDGTGFRSYVIKIEPENKTQNLSKLLSDLYEAGCKPSIEKGPLSLVAVVGEGIRDKASKIGRDSARDILYNTIRELNLETVAESYHQRDIAHVVIIEQAYAHNLVRTLGRNLGIINGK